MLVQVVGCSHHGTSIAVRERLAFTPEQTREALDHWRRVFPGVEAVLLSTCNRVEIYAATERAAGADARSDRQVLGPLPRPRSGRGRRTSVSAQRRGGGAAPVRRGVQPRQHGPRRAANSGPGEAGLPGGHRTGQHRAAAARRVSGGAAGGAARGRRNGHPPAARERAQRGRGRFRPADLRAIRRQEALVIGAGEMAEEMFALFAGGGRAADHGRQSAFRAGAGIGPAVARPGRAVGGVAAGAWRRPIWWSAPPAPASRSSRWRSSRRSRRGGPSGRC